MFSSIRSKLMLILILFSLGAAISLYLYVHNLQQKNSLLEAKTQSQDIVIQSYAENAEILRLLQEKTDKTIAGNRVAQVKINNQLNNEKNILKKRLEDENDECLRATLPDSILSSLRQ